MKKPLKAVRQITQAEAVAQVRRIKAQNAGVPRVVSGKKWLDLLKECCDAEANVDKLKDTIEILNLKIEDLSNEKERLNQKIADFGSSENSLFKVKYNELTKEYAKILADRESRIAKAIRDLRLAEENQKYAENHIRDLNATIRTANRIVEELRQSKVNDEHLASKLLQFSRERDILAQRNTELEVRLDSLCCPSQRFRDNPLYVPCGRCTSCKLQAANDLINASLSKAQNGESEKQNLESELALTKGILEQTASNLAAKNKELANVTKEATAAKLEADTKVSADAYEKEVRTRIARDAEIGNLKEVIRLQNEGLTKASKTTFWFQADHAAVAIEAVKVFKKLRRME